jgi:2-phosphosulfolactate phosphatase
MIDVAFTAGEARLAEVTVVIDVLRATTTIVQALEAGYEQVLCADSLDRARRLAGPGRVLAGERRCRRPPGFALGNSPAETIPPGGRELVLATTNGAPAIVRAGVLSGEVLIACMLNLDAVVAAVAGHDVLVLCSGTDGRAALEDTYVAGLLVERLDGPRTDAAHVASAVARGYGSARDAFDACANARVLVAAGLEEDLDWCARESIVDLVPRLSATVDGIAAVRAAFIEPRRSMWPDLSLDVSEWAT